MITASRPLRNNAVVRDLPARTPFTMHFCYRLLIHTPAVHPPRLSPSKALTLFTRAASLPCRKKSATLFP